MAYCNDCNRLVILGKTLDGKEIPLDPKAAVYRVLEGDMPEEKLIDRLPAAMVAHSATCPAAKFSTPKRAEEKMFP